MGTEGGAGVACCPTCHGAAGRTPAGEGRSPPAGAWLWLAARTPPVVNLTARSDQLTEGRGGLGTPGRSAVQGWPARNLCPVTGCVLDTGGRVVRASDPRAPGSGDFPKAPVLGTAAWGRGAGSARRPRSRRQPQGQRQDTGLVGSVMDQWWRQVAEMGTARTAGVGACLREGGAHKRHSKEGGQGEGRAPWGAGRAVSGGARGMHVVTWGTVRHRHPAGASTLARPGLVPAPR